MSGENTKKTIYSAIQPSGELTLGNYLGALHNWALVQRQFHCFYCVADMHAITVRQNPTDLRRRTLDVFSLLLSVGIDPQECVLYMQSQVSAHAELAWILNCHTYMGELSRMTQYKEKSKKQEAGVSAGLFTYPCLMAADILLYQADLVPVGRDQTQHVELARDIAERMNGLYGDLFTVPEPLLGQMGSKIMSLQDPAKKMSKSDDNENSYILLLDSPDAVARKIRRAVTDSEAEVRYDEQNKPGVSNLITIYAVSSNTELEDAKALLEGKNYGFLKEAVTEAVVGLLAPIQEKYARIRKDTGYLNELLASGRERAAEVAGRTLDKVHRKVGLAPFHA